MKNIILYISYTLVIIAAVIYMPFQGIAPYIMVVGAAGLFIMHFAERYEGKNIRLRRIVFIRHLIGLAYGLSAYFMFRQGMYWLIALMVAAVLEIYTLWVIGRESENK